VFIGACSKEEPKNNQEFKESIEDPTGLIKSFVHKMEMHKEGSILKSGQAMTVDSAIWYIDATINYTYANASHPFAKIHRDTIYIEMKLVNSYEASYEDVIEAYDTLLNAISRQYYERVKGENKEFIMAMVEDKGSLPDNKRSLRIITVIGTGNFQHSGEFGVSESYFYNRDANYNCSWESAPGAPIIFETMLSTHFNPPPSNPYCRWYFYGATTTVTYYYEDHQLNTTPANYLDYKIYAASSDIGDGLTDEVKCLEWNQNNSGLHEMQFYYDYLKIFVSEWLGSSQNTENKKLAPSFIYSRIINPGNETIVYHEPNFYFRKRGLVCQIKAPLPHIID
jgi:hypothetical protein